MQDADRSPEPRVHLPAVRAGDEPDVGHHRHPQLRPRVDLHVLGLHGLPHRCRPRPCRSSSCILIGVVVGAADVAADPGAGVRADHQTGQGQTDRRDADPHRRHRRGDHPAGHRAAPHQEQPVRVSTSSSFEVTTWSLGDCGSPTSQLMTIVARRRARHRDRVWLRRSRNGLALRSIGVDSEVASMMGVDRRRLALVTMAISGGLAGLAGVLLTFTLGAITPGERRHPAGQGVRLHHPRRRRQHRPVSSSARTSWRPPRRWSSPRPTGSWVDAVSFGLIFLVLLVRPAGVFGRKEVRRT